MIKFILALCLASLVVNADAPVKCSSRKVSELYDAEDKIKELKFELQQNEQKLQEYKDDNAWYRKRRDQLDSCVSAVKQYITNPVERDYWLKQMEGDE